MARLNMDHEHVRSQLYRIVNLHDIARHAVGDLIIKLSDADDWYPEALRRELLKLQHAGELSEANRHVVEKVFFPEHSW